MGVTGIKLEVSRRKRGSMNVNGRTWNNLEVGESISILVEVDEGR